MPAPQKPPSQSVRLWLTGGAVFDSSRRYRYGLWRRWDDDLPRVAFILLNPSTATASCDDPTIRRCIRFAHDWGYGSVDIVNIFAFRSTDSKRLRFVRDPVGPQNDRHILRAVRRCRTVVAAWGVHGELHNRGDQIAETLRRRTALHVLQCTRDGHPRHPLYLPACAKPVPWRPSAITLE